MRPLVIDVADAGHLPEQFAEDLQEALAGELGIEGGELALELRPAPGTPIPGHAVYLLYVHGQELGQTIEYIAETLAPLLKTPPTLCCHSSPETCMRATSPTPRILSPM